MPYEHFLVPGAREALCHAVEHNGILAIIHVDKDGYIIGCNDVFCQMTGYTESELLGTHWEKITTSESIAFERVERKKLIDGLADAVGPFRKRYLHKSDGTIQVAMQLNRIEVGGKFLCLIGQAVDLAPIVGRRLTDPINSSGYNKTVEPPLPPYQQVLNAVGVIWINSGWLFKWVAGLSIPGTIGAFVLAYSQLSATWQNGEKMDVAAQLAAEAKKASKETPPDANQKLDQALKQIAELQRKLDEKK